MKKQTAQISKEDAEAFTSGIGQITAGSYQLILLAHKQGVPKALGYASTPEWVNERLGGYVRYSVESRQKLVEEMVANGESQTNIANALGVGHATVHFDRKKTNRYKGGRGSHSLQSKNTKIRDSEDSPPELTPSEVQAKLQRTADQGFELFVWEKVKDKFLPVWFELLEMLEPDEREILPWAILNHAPLEERNKNETA